MGILKKQYNALKDKKKIKDAIRIAAEHVPVVRTGLKQHDALTDKEKNNFEQVVHAAAEHIPVVGAGVEFATALKEWRESKKETIIPKMIELAEPSELSDVEKEFMENALYDVLSDPNIIISEYVMKKKDELSALIVKNYETSLIEGKASEKVENFAKKIAWELDIRNSLPIMIIVLNKKIKLQKGFLLCP